MNRLSFFDWIGIIITVLLLTLTVVDNVYLMFAVYGLTLVSGSTIILRKNINEVGAIVIVIGSTIGITLTLIKMMLS